MMNQAVDPKVIVFDKQQLVDEAVREAIAEEGLYDEPKCSSQVRNMIAVRRNGNRFRVVKGMDELRAVLDLLDKDEECYDSATGHMFRASKLYNTIRVVVFD
jgi:hypothetical protein